MGVISDAALRAALPEAQRLGILDLFVLDSGRLHGSGIRGDRSTLASAARDMFSVIGTCPTCFTLVEASRWEVHIEQHRPRQPDITDASMEPQRVIELGPAS